jgi:hypothetical protein
MGANLLILILAYRHPKPVPARDLCKIMGSNDRVTKTLDKLEWQVWQDNGAVGLSDKMLHRLERRYGECAT